MGNLLYTTTKVWVIYCKHRSNSLIVALILIHKYTDWFKVFFLISLCDIFFSGLFL